MKLKTLAGLIGIVTLINLLTRFMGFIREIIIGTQFGTSSMADNVVLAYTIPNFLYLVLGGAITTSFISIYNKIDSDLNKEQFKKVILTYSSIIVLVITIILLVFNNKTISIMFPGVVGEKKEILETLFFITTPSTFFLVLSMWFSGVLNIHGKYIGASLSTFINNLVFILFVLLAYPILGVYSYGWGALLSALIMFLLLFIELKKGGFLPFSLSLHYSNKSDLIRMSKILIPILLGGATLQFYFITQRFFASYLTEGYIAAINYATKLVQLPQTILMTSVTTIIYPLLAKKAANKEFSEIGKIFKKGDHLLVLYLIPLSIFVYFFSNDIVSFIFEYGSFDKNSTDVTSAMLKIFVIGMHAHAANMYITRFYYALEKAIYPVVIGLLSVFGLNIFISYYFLDSMGADAVAWGTTISAYFQYFTLLIIGKYKLNLDIRLGTTNFHYLLIIISQCLIMFIARPSIKFNISLLNLFLGGILFLITYLPTLHFLGYSIKLPKRKGKVNAS
ncbi:putative peptidoglycan lipid II flippase [Neobacillus niacini]|uniref:murein biosynthesis integral membrane protein MurJ n=1 Tax=Neobacillus niacini TaxID=86668 RepID=UPI00285CC4E3|nr:murein biosynthesis integral membrane protein MurJ [Neobacillus niacini]MDR7078855.1 putative peptidoglycan lipid II flippase [Neobacillus niacini]